MPVSGLNNHTCFRSKMQFIPIAGAILVILSSHFVISNSIGNRIVSAQLICTDRDMELHVVVENPLFQQGRAFVKGRSGDINCRHIYRRSVTNNALMFKIPLGTCGMFRVAHYRKSYSFTVTVIVSLHHLFITNVDRAFRLTCQYRNEKVDDPRQLRQTIYIGVSMLPTTVLAEYGFGTRNELEENGDNIRCSYNLYKGRVSEFGLKNIVKFAKIGDLITHIWKCDNLNENQFIWIHNCVVNPEFNGENDPLAIDNRGCTVDPVIMSKLEYVKPLNHVAIGRHLAYKFADYPNLLFKCSINICDRSDAKSCQNADGQPVVVPPICTSEYIRNKRKSNNSIEFSDSMVEVLSGPLEVMEILPDDSEEIHSLICASNDIAILAGISTLCFIFVCITFMFLVKFIKFKKL